LKQYFFLASASLASMFAGSQVMHSILKPDLSLDVAKITKDIESEILAEITLRSNNLELKETLAHQHQQG